MAHFRRARRALAVENLESKRLLAGDVSVATIGGSLFLDGDAAGNQVQIRSLDGPGRFALRGLAGPNGHVTTINGSAEPLLVDGIIGQVMANMGAGNDAVVIRGARFASAVFVNTGLGDDAVIVGVARSDPSDSLPAGQSESMPSVVVGGALVIQTGPGSDVVSEHRTLVNGPQIVQTGVGDDTVRIGVPGDSGDHGRSVVIKGTLVVGLGWGDDTLGSHGLAAAHVAINGSQGSDQIAIHDARINRSLVINGGAGEDHVAISQSHSSHARVHGGLGPDQVASIDSVFGNLAIHLGQGNDTTLAVRTTVHGAALFSGGAGMDSLHGGMNSFNHVRAVGFEAHGADADDEDDPSEDLIAQSSSIFV